MFNNKMNRRAYLKTAASAVGAWGLMSVSAFPRINDLFTQQKKKKNEKEKKQKEEIQEKTYYRDYVTGELIYENSLSKSEDVSDFKLEGEASITFPENRMRLENELPSSLGQKANFVLWCPKEFPDDIVITWNFYPIKEPGLCILFFAAEGRNGKSIFDPSLAKRTGEYKQYHHGDINAYHVSYFRRRSEDARAFHLCNLRKSYGFYMVAQGADPIPSVIDCVSPYKMKLVKLKGTVELFIDELSVLKWQDDGNKFGPLLHKGRIGFRQMAPLIADYSDFKVHKVKRA